MRNIIFAVGGAAIATALISAANSYFNLPVAQFSNSTKECVKVVQGEYSCETLPAKHLIEWVR